MKFKNMFRLNRQSKRYKFILSTIETEEISVLGIIKYLLSFSKIVIISTVAFFIIGVFQANNNDKSYTAKSVIIPDGGAPPPPQAAMGLEAFLPAQPSTTSTLGIESFSGIIESSPFLLDMLEEPILSEQHGGYLTMSEYLQKIQTTSRLETIIAKLSNLPNKFFQLFEFKDDEPVAVSSKNLVKMPTDTLYEVTVEQLSLMAQLRARVRIDGSNPVTIETDMPTAKLSVRLNNLVLDKLVEETIEIRTGKQQRDLMLIKKQLDTAQTNFEESQLALARFKDKNFGGMSAIASTELENLSTAYSLYSGIYAELASKIELMKIDLLENTPFYNVFEPAYVPLFPNGEFSVSSVIRFSIFGVVFGILWIMGYTGLVIFGILRNKLEETSLDKE